MQKLLKGILDFRDNVRPKVRETYAKLALGQRPDVLMIACSDSRVAPNVFASTDPGDLFVVRNVGNLVPPHSDETAGHSAAVASQTSPTTSQSGTSKKVAPGAHAATQVTTLLTRDTSVPAAIEFSLSVLKVLNVIVCGHSECGAMNAIYNQNAHTAGPHVEAWLNNGVTIEGAARTRDMISVKNRLNFSRGLSEVNKLSQLNVLAQIEHLKSYPVVRAGFEAGQVKLHAWWFDIENAEVLAYRAASKSYQAIDEAYIHEVL